MRGKKRKPKTSLSIEFDGIDDVRDVTIVTGVVSEQNFFHLDELPDGTWRLVYNELMIPDTTKLKGIKIVRNKKG